MQREQGKVVDNAAGARANAQKRLSEDVLDLRIPVVHPAEWRFPLAVALALLLLTAAAYLYGYLSTPADKQFMGIMVNVPDHVQYFSWMRELGTANLAANKLTPEANEPVFFNLLWWGMARIGNALHLDYAAMFQVLRWVATLLCLPLLYLLIAWFVEPRLWRRTAFLVTVLGAGLGWLLVVGKYTVMQGTLLWPLDLYVAEPNTFFSILASPHFIAALLYLAVFDLFLRGAVHEQWRYPLGAGMLALFLGWQHAYDLLIIYAVIGVWTLLWWLRLRRFPRFLFFSCILIGAISVWPALYSVLLTSLDPLWEEVLAQFANAGVYTPPPLRLLILLGIPFMLALYGALRQRPWRLEGISLRMLLLQGWFWVYFLLAYLPTDYQIHMLNGWQAPIAILATIALFDGIQPRVARWLGVADHEKEATPTGFWSKQRLSLALAALLVLLVVPTNLYLYAWRYFDLSRHEAPYYLYKDEIAGLRWLEENAQGDDVVMASLNIGQYVPALTGAHAVLAHWAQTVDFYGKSAAVAQFYAESTDAETRSAILDDLSVDYVFVGPSENAEGSFTPQEDAEFSPVFQNESVTIFAFLSGSKTP